MLLAKGGYPWRVGATSFVLPAGVEENVAFLADKVDDIQLLFFESSSQSLLPHHVNMPLLAAKAVEHDVSYTIHLPSDIRAGANSAKRRQDGVDEIARLFEELLPLDPLAFDLHLAAEKELSRGQWQENVSKFLKLLQKNLGRESCRLAIENIDYPFSDIKEVVVDHGFSLCLDFGHALFYDDEPKQLLKDIAKAKHIHYHGIVDGKDHQALGQSQSAFSRKLGSQLLACNYTGVVTLELYHQEKLRDSLLQLHADWQDWANTEKCVLQK